LRAELHEAETSGPGLSNRRAHPQYRAHLEGRIGFVQATNPRQAQRLWATFDRINWTETWLVPGTKRATGAWHRNATRTWCLAPKRKKNLVPGTKTQKGTWHLGGEGTRFL